MALDLELLTLSTALLLAAALWPALAQAARRRQLTTTGRRLRSPRATLLGFLGPVALTAAAMALMVAVRFL
ncbi:hypothetical protein [Kocuria sp. CPCC 205263]|uniref:hypothetical protein n=1 Tax=Kocuria sp. CPCC 205263 TaxID=3073555 RepID=UPI0034D574DB